MLLLCTQVPNLDWQSGSTQPHQESEVWKLDRTLAPRASLRLKITQIGTTMGSFLWYHWLLVDQRRLLYWYGDGQKEHLSFMFVLALLWPGIYSGSCTGTQVMNVSPSGLSLGGILEGYSDCTLGGIRGKQGFNGEELDISLGCHQVYPWCIYTLSRWQNWDLQVWHLHQ